ncbi:UNVERIFIED_CONTAM: hypothetical protein H355_011352 [Colinus virginianus]|nr:hypothetical protein H355_011352 [Colinus virginianus]
MYGFVNHALELLVIRNYGPAVWEDINRSSSRKQIRREAQLDEEGQFLVRIIYDDSKTYDLVAAASKVLNLNAGEILQMFGKMFFVFCQESGYDTILRVLGSNVREFLQNLDALHDHLATIYPGMRAPSFRCTDAEKGKGLILHYYSEREGLQDIVIGIIKTVAQQIHGTEIDMKVIQQRNEECDHIQFLIEEKESKEEDYYEDLDRFEENGTQESRISPYTFCKAFPFHIIFDRDLVVTQCGNAIYRVLPQLQPGNCSLLSVFSLVRPHIDISFHGILSHINTVFVLRTKVETVGDKYMTVSGLPEPCIHHARSICHLALDMMEIAGQVQVDGEPVQITIGIHTGEVVTGVIGQRMPRYCLFGNTVNLTSRTETTGEKGKINVSEYTYRCLMTPENSDPQFHLEYRGPVSMKGKKEPMQVWFLSRKSTETEV